MSCNLKGLIQLLLMPNIVKSPFKHNWGSVSINAEPGPAKSKQQTGALNYRHSRKNETPQAIIRKLGKLKKQNSSPVIFIFRLNDASKGINPHFQSWSESLWELNKSIVEGIPSL